MPEVSIVMPAYNAEKYISEAIESVRGQDFADWELIIVDDASTDNTLKIIEYYAKGDARIKYVSSAYNSGSARVPRLKAVSIAVSDWIFNLDADDFIASDFLSKMICRAERTHSDIVLSQMQLVDESKNSLLSCIPESGYDMNQILTGRQALTRTIGKWEIGCNGLVKTDYYRRLPNDRQNEMNMDEVDSRRLLLMADQVAFCEGVYYYRQHENSITKKISMKLFDRMCTSFELLNFLSKAVPEDKEICILQMRECWASVSNSLLLLFKYRSSFTAEERLRVHWKIVRYYEECQRQQRYLRMSAVKKMFLLRGYCGFFWVKLFCFNLQKLTHSIG